MGFLSHLVVTPLKDGRSWVLREPLVYEDEGERHEIPTMFVTDFASVPRPLWWLISPTEEQALPAVAHDWDYVVQRISRRKADLRLLRLMRKRNVQAWKRVAIFWAVRLFGWWAWHRNRMDRRAGVRRVLDVLPHPDDAVPPRGLDRIARCALNRMRGKAA